MAAISFTNLTVSGNMSFEGIPFDAFRRILDFVESQTHGAIPTGTDLNDLSEGTQKEAEVTVQGNAAEVVVPDEKPDAAKEDPPKIDPYLLVGNYAGKDSVVRILKDYTGNPEGYTQEWMTTRQWMEKVDLGSSVTLFNVAHILSDCAKAGLLERRADYNPEEHKNEVRFLLPAPVPVKKDTIGSRIHKARKENGFLATELADLLGYSDALLLKWEKDELVPSSEAMENLKKALGDDLFDGLGV